MEDTKAITVIDRAYVLPDKSQLKRDLQDINEFQNIVHANLISDIDYGTIIGTNKPTLYKSGAEKIVKLLRLSDRYEILPPSKEDWDKPFFYYQIRCTLTYEATGEVVSEGLGSCNSYEDKYRYRWLWPGDVPDGADKAKMVTRRTKKGGLQYRVDNDEVFTIVNTLLKMAKKRALIDAALSAGRLSNAFTQDIEDIKAGMEDEDVVDAEVEDVTEKESDFGKCPECNSDIVMRKGKYGDFLACSGYPKCQYKPPKKGKDTTPAGKTSEKAPEAPKSTDWERVDGKNFDEALVEKIRGLNWTPQQAKDWLFANFDIPNSRAIKTTMRNDVMAKLDGMTKEINM